MSSRLEITYELDQISRNLKFVTTLVLVKGQTFNRVYLVNGRIYCNSVFAFGKRVLKGIFGPRGQRSNI